MMEKAEKEKHSFGKDSPEIEPVYTMVENRKVSLKEEGNKLDNNQVLMEGEDESGDEQKDDYL